MLTVYETLAVIAVGKLDIEGCFVLLWDLGGQVRDDVMNGGRRIKSQGLWCIFASEQVRMRSIWDKYYADAHGVIFVVDAADVARFEEAKLAFCG